MSQQLHRHCICCFYLLILLSILHMSPSSFCAAADADDDYTRADFPTEFVFGAGTSAYQVEGAAFEDGRTPSIWDTLTHTSNFPRGNGDIACDHYHKYKEDVQLMAEIGLEAYRFSISWSRLIPNGRGPVNPKGLQFYNNLINELIKHGIQPHVTLHHIDAPQALEDEYAGWISRKIVKDFTAYADVCFKEFGDRIRHWTTINEPSVFALGGYDFGFSPPGRCSLPFGFGACAKGNSTTEPYIVVHNMLLAHASVFRLYQKKYKAVQNGFVGTNIYAAWFFPSSNTTEDVIATQRALDFYIGWFSDPLVYGDYPNIVKKNAGTRIPAFTRYESKLVKGAFDFIGLNHYSSVFVKDNPSSLAKEIRDVNDDMAIILQYQTENTYPDQVFSPVALSALLEYIKLAYGNPPVYIHENGARTQRNGTLMDVSRVKFVHAYIGNLLAAIRNGSNTKGYILWSFLDGYELLDGYGSAYGLYYVDLDDKQLRRYPKLSSYWYSNFLKSRSIRHDKLIEVNTEFIAKDDKVAY